MSHQGRRAKLGDEMRPLKARLIVPVLLLTLVALSLSGGAGTTDRTLSADRAAGQTAVTAYRALPLAFMRNAGQLDRRVRYSAEAGSMSVFLTRRALILSLAGKNDGVALRLGFLGTNSSSTIAGAGRNPGRVSYLIGNDPSRWQRNLPTYQEVVYRGLWPGVDLAVRGRGGQLKYEFRLAPQADPARIRLRYRGQQRLSLDGAGALRVETALGVLHDGRPLSYQPVAGRRVAVESRFALGQGGAYGLALGEYDRRRPLVIDPGLRYSTYLGGEIEEHASAITVDKFGHAYVTGTTSSSDFPTTAGAFDRKYNGRDLESDIFVAKLNEAGSRLAYATYLGGRLEDRSSAIAIDKVGRAYITGETGSRNFPTTAGAFDRSYNGGDSDAFVVRLSVDGSRLAYSTYIGGTYFDGGHGIAVGGSRNAYVTGSTGSPKFPTTADAFDRRNNGGDAFVTRLNAAGSALVYSTFLGGSGGASGAGIAVDRAGGVYVTGGTSSADFPTTAGAFDRSYNGGGDAFVTKLITAGSALAYSTYLGGSGLDGGNAIAVSGPGSAYLTGVTWSRNFPTTRHAFDRSHNGESDDAFVTKVSATGAALAYSSYLGGSGDDAGYAIAVGGAGSAYVTGSTHSRRFPATRGAFDRAYNGGVGDMSGDAFLAKVNTAGSALAYSTYLGGYDTDAGAGIAFDGSSAYLAGDTRSSNFPVTTRALDRRFDHGPGDAFVTKFARIAGPDER